MSIKCLQIPWQEMWLGFLYYVRTKKQIIFCRNIFSAVSYVYGIGDHLFLQHSETWQTYICLLRACIIVYVIYITLNKSNSRKCYFYFILIKFSSLTYGPKSTLYHYSIFPKNVNCYKMDVMNILTGFPKIVKC